MEARRRTIPSSATANVPGMELGGLVAKELALGVEQRWERQYQMEYEKTGQGLDRARIRRSPILGTTISELGILRKRRAAPMRGVAAAGGEKGSLHSGGQGA